MKDHLLISISSNNGKKIIVNSKGVTIDGHSIYENLTEKIIQVAVEKNMILVVTDHPDFHRQLSYSMPLVRQKGNILAFDTSGNLLWRIEDIVSEFRVAFDIAYIVSDKERAEKE